MFNLNIIIMTKRISPLKESAGVYACLLYDATLKTVLGGVENEALFKDIIEFLIPGKHISKIEKLDKEKHGLVVSEKVVIFDLLCQDADTGEEFLVEVQNAPDRTFKDRALYYSLVPVREQMERKLIDALSQEEGDDDEQDVSEKEKKERDKMDYSIRPVYVISLVNFNLKHDSPEALEDEYVSRYELRSVRNGELMTEALNFIFVEMDRLPYRKNEYSKCKNRLERFIFAFKYMHTFVEFPREFETDPMLGKLAKAAELAKMSVLKREEYDTAMKDILARLSEINTAKAEERTEAMAEVAKAMLADDVDLAKIAEYTGLTVDEVQALQQ